MKPSNLLVVSSAFLLAVAGTAMNEIQQEQALLRIVAPSEGICLVFTQTIEPNCALANTGPQCTVWYELDEGTVDILPAYVTPLTLPLCVLPLRRNF